MKRVYGEPNPDVSQRQNNNGIMQVVVNLAYYLREFGYTLCNTPDGADLIAHHAGSGSTLPDVAFYHGVYPTYHKEFGDLFHEINRRVLQNVLAAKAVIAPSEWIADTLRRDLHVSPDVISWGVNVEEWGGGENHGYVLWNKNRAGDVCTPKWVNMLADAEKGLQFVSTFGDKKDNLQVIGVKPFAEMKGIIKNAACYLASTKETGDIGSKEALAAGVPVLGFAQGALLETVTHGYNGFLAEVGDFEGLRAGLHWVLQNRTALSHNAQKSAHVFSWRVTAEKVAHVFERTLLEKAAPYKVSVIIPCYNYGHFVGQAIESALHQDCDFPYEIIVINDGSTDNSEEIIKAYEPRIRYVRTPNQGAANARNLGIELAQSDYIVCLDADDAIGTGFLRLCAGSLDANRLTGIAYTRLQIMGSGPSSWLAGSFDYELFIKQVNQVPTCCMFRKEAWKRAGGYRQYQFPAEDADLWIRITSLGYGAVKASDQALFIYRAHPQSATAKIRGGKGHEPAWAMDKGYLQSGHLPALAGGTIHKVRDYDQPLVSFVVPVGKGHETAVLRALDSIENQSYPFWEGIVVNDTGREIPKLPAWAKVYVCDQRSAGAARNVGLAHARGMFTVFLDADDYLDKDFIMATYEAYRLDTSYYVYTDWTDEKGAHETPTTAPDAFQVGSYHAITTLIPTEWVKAVGGFDETMEAWEDWDFFSKLHIAGHCGKRLAKALFHYTTHTGQRREIGVKLEKKLKAEIKARYLDYIEGRKQIMCNCNNKKALPSLHPDSAAKKMVLVEYQGAVGKHTVYGYATRQFYGRRTHGDRFLVFSEDLQSNPDFKLIEELQEVTITPPTTIIPDGVKNAAAD